MLCCLFVEREGDDVVKFGEISSKFDGIENNPFPDTCKDIADQFHAMVSDRQAGWYEAKLVYRIDESGTIDKIDELRIVFSGN